MNKPASPRFIRRYSTSILSVLRQNYQDDQPEELTWQAVFDENGHLNEEWKLQHGESSPEIHKYIYDEKGRLLEHHLSIPDDGIEERFVTKRDEQGRATEICKYYGDDPGERTVYSYDKGDDPIEVTIYDADGEFERKEEVTYNDQQHIAKRIVTPADGQKRIYDYSYNDKGWLMKVEEKDEKDKLLGRQEHEYTPEGLETRIRQTNGDGKQINEIISEYDALGRLIRKTTRGFHIRIHAYEYDEAGNIIEESLSDENNFVISRNRFEFDPEKRLLHETVYETDLTRAGRDTHLSNRYEYEF
jgi:YD repeat-containing protein